MRAVKQLSRRGKALRNLLTAGLLGAAVWGMAGSPMPDLWKFRAMERQALTDATEIIMEIQEGEAWGHGYLGLGEDAAIYAVPGMDYLQVHLLSDDPRLMALSSPFTLWEPEGPVFAAAYAGIDPPEEAVYGELILQLEEKSISVSGQRRGDVILFLAAGAIGETVLSYQLTYYDQAYIPISEERK